MRFPPTSKTDKPPQTRIASKLCYSICKQRNSGGTKIQEHLKIFTFHTRLKPEKSKVCAWPILPQTTVVSTVFQIKLYGSEWVDTMKKDILHKSGRTTTTRTNRHTSLAIIVSFQFPQYLKPHNDTRYIASVWELRYRILQRKRSKITRTE